MANFGSPAHTAAMGNAAGMMVIAGGAMCLARGVSDALDAVAEARYQRRYHDALGAATTHARELENVARVPSRSAFLPSSATPFWLRGTTLGSI